MRAPHPNQVLELFEELSQEGGLRESLRPEGAAFSRQRAYSLGVVVRLMMLQRLLGSGTLSTAVQYWLQSRPVGQGTSLSPRTGAYSQARQKLPREMAVQVLNLIVERLSGWLPRNPILPDQPVFVLDGSTLSLPHAPELVEAYPPPCNQYGASHWPLLRVVVLQDIQTGLALPPHWGPHHGPNAVSEQELAFQAIPDLPERAVVMGDRNFGVFAIAWAAAQQRSEVLVRLTRQRAEALAGGPLLAAGEWPVSWKPTRFDRCGGPFPAAATVEGRLVCLASSSQDAPEPFLYFFTTLTLPLPRLGDLYRLRWNVETDLRSLKQTVRLQQLTSRSCDMLAKELLLAVATYNLVRAVLCLAAEKAQVQPRRISFTSVYTLVETFLPDILTARSQRQWKNCWERILSLATAYKLPVRAQPRSYPRAVWRRPTRLSRT